jgi:hypothetical protein
MFVFAHDCNQKPTNKPRLNQTKTFRRDRGNSLVIVGIQKKGVFRSRLTGASRLNPGENGRNNGGKSGTAGLNVTERA